ncbi:MAG: hypothetical protein IE878_06585, partial [Epsilonproteobacteria bacterium]|nr:hypothetical protein [Campylobacterota bacterium]
MARKIIIFTIDELNAIVKCLSRHDNEFNIPFSSDVKSFIKETGEEWKSTKNITQVRATTLSVDIYSFYFQNKIVMEEEILYFIKKIEENIEDGVARAFFDTANKIGRLLNRCAKRRFLEADVYFCDKDMLSAVLSVQEEYEAQLTTSYQQRYLGFNKILNILNDKEACFDYSVSYIPRSKTISVEKSVEHYINGEFE